MFLSPKARSGTFSLVETPLTILASGQRQGGCHHEPALQVTHDEVWRAAFRTGLAIRGALLRIARQGIRTHAAARLGDRIDPTQCAVARGGILSRAHKYPTDATTHDSGWRILGWCMADGSMPLDDYDAIGPELAKFDYLPVPKSTEARWHSIPPNGGNIHFLAGAKDTSSVCTRVQELLRSHHGEVHRRRQRAEIRPLGQWWGRECGNPGESNCPKQF